MAEFFVDLSAESNGSGTEGSPYNSFTSLNSSGWARGNTVYIKRGSRRVVNAGTRAMVRCTTGSGRLLITAYGDPALPMPVIDGGGTTFNPFWVQAGSGIDIEFLHVTNAPGSCMTIEQSAAGSADDISDVEVRDCLVTRCGQNPALIGVDGLRVGAITWMAGTISNVRLKRIVARDNGGHGIKIRGHASDVTVDDCVALRNGYISPSHGMGTSGSFVQAAGAGWTNISGDIWEKTVSVPGSASFTGWRYVYVAGASPFYGLYPAAFPALPGPGECGHGAANTLRVNLGGLDPSGLTNIAAHFNGPQRVWFRNCVGMHTIDADGIEGQGVYFDSGSFQCWSIKCFSAYNEGEGFQMNQTTDCGHYAGLAFSNGRGGAKSGASTRSNFHGMTLIADNLPGINFQTGNSGGSARMNKIIGASVGIRTNDVGTNSVDEDENVFVGCATRLTAVSGPGARSRDEAAIPTVGAGWAFERIRAAEELI
jgi:hypothetical protein